MALAQEVWKSRRYSAVSMGHFITPNMHYHYIILYSYVHMSLLDALVDRSVHTEGSTSRAGPSGLYDSRAQGNSRVQLSPTVAWVELKHPY